MSVRIDGLLKGFMAAALALGGAAPAFADDDERTPAEIIEAAPADAWRTIDPENTLLLEIAAGVIVIELRPDLAPAHVAQIKTLVRQGFYDGLGFHRVIEGFVAQGGDPKGDGTGDSELPDIPAEFAQDTAKIEGFTPIGRDRIAARVGFVDGVPVAAQPESLRSFRADRTVSLWGLHCPGVMSMARSPDPNSANSQFFIVIGDARSNLDQRYTVWGWIVDGFEHTRRILRGEPPTRQTKIVRARIAADVPVAERPRVEILRTDSETFLAYIKAANLVREGFVRNMCGVKPIRRVDGQLEI